MNLQSHSQSALKGWGQHCEEHRQLQQLFWRHNMCITEVSAVPMDILAKKRKRVIPFTKGYEGSHEWSEMFLGCLPAVPPHVSHDRNETTWHYYIFVNQACRRTLWWRGNHSMRYGLWQIQPQICSVNHQKCLGCVNSFNPPLLSPSEKTSIFF